MTPANNTSGRTAQSDIGDRARDANSVRSTTHPVPQNGDAAEVEDARPLTDRPGHDPDPETVAELRRLARSTPTSGRAALAKASALRTLERLSRERRKQVVPPMPAGWYPHEPGDPFYELDWEFLHEHPRILRRHWESAWRAGRV
jgi:hypothetical protein